jgi:hypothetical protein
MHRFLSAAGSLPVHSQKERAYPETHIITL